MKKVTIVIPNYNGLKFMEPCMAALDKQLCRDFELLVVDNGSTDGSVEWLKEHGLPSLFLETNTGFSGAVNVGIKAAKTPYVILLNNDTEAEPEYVGELLKAIEASPKIFSVSPKMIQLYHKELMDDGGDMYSIMGWAYQRGVGQEIERYDRPCHIFSACAGAAIYRREVFEEIGYFDEMHFAYLEDMDLCWRARIHGWKSWYEPDAEVFHVGSATSGSRYNRFKVLHSAGNNLYMIYKNMPLAQMLLNLPFLLVGFLIKYLFFVKKGLGKDYREGLARGFELCRKHKDRKVRFLWKNLPAYVAIQVELWKNILLFLPGRRGN